MVQQKSDTKEAVKRVAVGLIKKKILLAVGPTALVIIAVIIAVALIMSLGVVIFGGGGAGDSEGGTDQQCLDVGTPTPQLGGVTRGSSGSSSGGSPTGTAEISEDDLGLPVPYDWVKNPTSGFGPRWGSFHDGIDYAHGPEVMGHPMYSVADGTVVAAGPATGYGNWVRIMHDIDGQKVESLYGHIEDGHVYVKEGDQVKAGDHIADVGNAGFSSGPHLHFGVYPGGWSQGGGVDPEPWLPKFQEAAKKSGGRSSGDSQREDNDSDRARTEETSPENSSADGIVSVADWEKLAECEAGGNWQTSTGNGYSGGLQFAAQTWSAFGGDEYAPTADKASKEEQMEVANNILKSQGWGAWPACTAGFGPEFTKLKPAPEGTFVKGESSDDEKGDKSSDDDQRSQNGSSSGNSARVKAGDDLPKVDKGNYGNANSPVENGLQSNALKVIRNVHARYPEVETYGGLRPGDRLDHGTGTAIDIMLVPHTDPAWVALGDEINAWLQNNAEDLGIKYLIWKQRIWHPGSPPDKWDMMEERGDPTKNHYDHIHVSVNPDESSSAATEVKAIPGMDDPYGPPETTVDGKKGEDAGQLTREDGTPGRGAISGDTSSVGTGNAADGEAAKAFPGISPYTPEGPQLAMELNQEQQSVVQAIDSAAKESRLPEDKQPRAAVLAAALAGQSSNFINRRSADDRNRVGIFAEAGSRNTSNRLLEDPKQVARGFYKKLREEYKDDDSWATDPLNEVIVRLYPERESLKDELVKWENIAIDAVAKLWHTEGAEKGDTISWSQFDGTIDCALGAFPGEGTSGSSSRSGTSSTGAALKEGEVPEEFVKWIKLGAKVCDAVTEPVLAAQLYLESGFKQHGHNSAGAAGYSQFIDGTWQAYGYKVDENGEPIGPPGSGDRNNVGDAVMAQARYNCDNAETIEKAIDEGKVTGDPTELMLAAYQAGVGNVLRFGGLPTDISDGNMTPAEYAQHIVETSKQFEDATKKPSSSSDKKKKSSSNDLKSKIIEEAESQLGVPYSWGGGSLDGPSEGFGNGGAGIIGFDCSSLTRYAVWQASGEKIDISRSTNSQPQSKYLRKVDKPEPGDLVYTPGHVAIYVGDDKTIEAYDIGEDVRYGKYNPNSTAYEVVPGGEKE